MATIEYWIQLENRQWDVSPNNIDSIRTWKENKHGSDQSTDD